MSAFTIFPLQHNIWQKISAVLLFIMSLIWIANSFNIINLVNLSERDNIVDILNLIIVFSLFIMTFSKEKIEDERVHRIRYKSLTGSFSILTTILIVFSFSKIISTGSEPFGGDLLIFPFISLLYYQVLFRCLLWKDPEIVYNDGTVSDNFKGHGALGFILLILILTIIAVLI